MRKRPCPLSEDPAGADVVVPVAVLEAQAKGASAGEATGPLTEILLDRGRMATDHRKGRVGLVVVVVPAAASDPRQNL